MKHPTLRSVAIIALSLLAFVGAGCSRAPSSGSRAAEPIVSPTIEERSTEAVPKQPWEEYVSAPIRTDGLRVASFDRSEGRISMSVPGDWNEEGAVWRADDGKLNHVRIAHFSEDGPIMAWEKQKTLGVHDVAHAEQIGDRYFLMVNHPGLQASILKVFIPDAAHPGSAYYFFECRAAYGADRAAIWSACKGAYESFRIGEG